MKNVNKLFDDIAADELDQLIDDELAEKLNKEAADPGLNDRIFEAAMKAVREEVPQPENTYISEPDNEAGKGRSPQGRRIRRFAAPCVRAASTYGCSRTTRAPARTILATLGVLTIVSASTMFQ